MKIKGRLPSKIWNGLILGLAFFFMLNVFLIILTVLANSLGNSWFQGLLPDGFTLKWYKMAWKDFQLGRVLIVTSQVVLSVVAFSILLGVPAAYVMARRNFAAKNLVMGLFLLPMLIPPVTYGIPMATVMYHFNAIGGKLPGVILANLVPAIPFVIMVMTPFIEQIDQNIEHAAKVCGANVLKMFWYILVPLLGPGILAASLLVLVRTISMFELTFLVGGAGSYTLIVALYAQVFSAGIRTMQSIDAMAMIYMVTTLFWLLIALRFVNPTQLVSRVKEVPQD